ncbi:hypothetical protein ACFL12_05115 [Pseudomonadota bacterium]
MTHDTAYAMLMTSLPHLGSLFEARYSVISRIKLERRLKVLTPEDAETLAMVERVSCWDRLGGIKDDAVFAEQAKQTVTTLTDPLMMDIVRHRVELRTLVAALRRRHLGRGAPMDGEKWGFGRWMKVISRNWNEPGFGVQNAFPWILEAHRLLQENNTVALERLLLEEVWNELGRKAQGHHFDFAAVVIYVLRWDVMERWTHYQAPTAQERFNGLIDAAIGDHMKTETAHG